MLRGKQLPLPPPHERVSQQKKKQLVSEYLSLNIYKHVATTITTAIRGF